ncbi:MAG TPA: hypothetical protein VM305_11705 [Candidatus Limnocylindrales bacterium]|nr:hypothetical protein [Candidatus Limnocylindrales bacterium]
MAEQFDPTARDGIDFDGRLDDIERRIATLESDALPAGLTDPDPGSAERWEAAQVWAHMAEFIGYWHQQLGSVIGEFAGDPVPFGRIKTDPGRIAAIDLGRQEPVQDLIRRTRDALAGFRRDMGAFGTAEWNAIGVHETRGEMDVEGIVERFIVAHLEEHLDQLEALAASAR